MTVGEKLSLSANRVGIWMTGILGERDIVERQSGQAIRQPYKWDPVYSTLWIQHHTPRGYIQNDGLTFKQIDDRNLLCLPEGSHNGSSIRGFFIRYAHTLLAHLGSSKILLYIRRLVWWLTLVGDIRAYCEQCQICATGKSRTHNAWGLLQPPPVPVHPWEYISIDFLGLLLLSRTVSDPLTWSVSS